MKFDLFVYLLPNVIHRICSKYANC